MEQIEEQKSIRKEDSSPRAENGKEKGIKDDAKEVKSGKESHKSEGRHKKHHHSSSSERSKRHKKSKSKSHKHHHHSHHKHSTHHKHHGGSSSREKDQGDGRDSKKSDTRKRSRTRSPNPLLQHYEKVPEKRYGEQKMFWDGFQWVARTTPIVRNFEQTGNTKKVLISNVPLELDLRADDLKREFNKILKEKFKVDKDIITKLTLINAQNAVGVELSSKEHIQKIKDTFDKYIMLGEELRVQSFEDKTFNFNVSPAFGSTTSANTLVNPIANSAQTSAQAAAIATAAIKGMQGLEVNLSLQTPALGKATKILKVSKIIDPVDIYRMGPEINEIQMDMKEEFMKHGHLVDIRIIMPKKETLGAEAGSIFVEYENEKIALAATEQLKGRKYDNKLIRLAFVKPDLYEKQFKCISDSFITLELASQPPPEMAPPKGNKDELE